MEQSFFLSSFDKTLGPAQTTQGAGLTDVHLILDNLEVPRNARQGLENDLFDKLESAWLAGSSGEAPT